MCFYPFLKLGLSVSLLIYIFLFTGNYSYSQDDSSRLISAEIILARKFLKMHKEKSDAQIIKINDSIQTSFKKIFTLPESFFYPFDSLHYVGKLFPADSAFRLLNWNISLSDGTNTYFGFILLPDTATRSIRLIQLEDHSQDISNPTDTILTPSNWYGALYYDILTNKWGDNTYYTLLGIDYNDLFTTKKIIDILSIDKHANIYFGAPVFNVGEKVLKRVVFEFTSQASMLLHYDKSLNMIVFDHLSPSKPEYEGLYQFYGPDFSYDGFVFRNGMWRLQKDIDVRNR